MSATRAPGLRFEAQEPESDIACISGPNCLNIWRQNRKLKHYEIVIAKHFILEWGTVLISSIVASPYIQKTWLIESNSITIWNNIAHKLRRLPFRHGVYAHQFVANEGQPNRISNCAHPYVASSQWFSFWRCPRIRCWELQGLSSNLACSTKISQRFECHSILYEIYIHIIRGRSVLLL